MRKIFSLVCAVFMTVMMFGQSYGILVNGHTYFAGTPAGEYEGFTQYTAHVQINAGDYCQLYDASNGAAWAVKLNTYSEDGFTLNEDRYEVSVSGCYDFYIKLKYGADELYIGNGSDCGEGEEISGGDDEWSEIKFTEVVAAADIAADASFEADEFSIQITDPDNKMAIDANPCRFGTVEAFVDYSHRLKTGGKTNESVTKNFITATIPAAGQLRIAVRTGSNSDATRTLVIKQGEKELYNQVVKEADKTVVDETSYYPFITVDVAKGPVVLSYPVNGLNFYAFAFKAAEEQPGDDPGDEPGEGLKNPVLKVNVPADTKEVFVAGDFSEWAFLPMAAVKDVENQFTLTIEGEFEAIAYKYACGNDWAYREVAEDGTDIENRSYAELDVVAKWLAVPSGDDPGDEPGDEPGEGLKNPVLKVNVPADTKEVFVAGDFSEWAFLPMAAVKDVENQFTLTIEGEFEAIAYKYACGNDWAYREVAEDGTDIENRSYAELDVVAKWLAVPSGDDPGDEPKEGYALLVNGTEFIDLVHGEEYEGYDQWFVEGAALKAGDVVKVHSYETETSWAIGILNPASSKHVVNSEEGLVFDQDGEYTIYLKLKFEADEIYVAPLPDEGGDEPGEKIENPIFTVIVPEGTDSVFVAGSFDEWASFRKLSAVEGKDNQFTIQIEGEFEAIEYKYLAGPDWKYVEVREGDANRTFVVDALDEVSAWTSVPEGGEEPPTPGKEGYALLVNGTDLIDLTHGEEYEGYDQWFVEGAALKAGDVVKVHSYETEASWAIGILNPASSKHVANSEDGLVFDKDGEYTIYLKLKFEADEIYVAPLPDEGGDEPGEKIENPIFTVIVPEGTDSVFVAGSFDEWASFRKLSAVEGKDNQFTIQIEGEFEAIEYKYLAGPDWKYVEVREGDANRTFVVDALDEVSAWTSVPEGGEEPPTPGKEGYALLVNGTEFIDLVHGEEYEGYDQWFVEGAALKAGDVVKVHSYETETSWAIGILNPASSKHVVNSEEGLVFDQDGEYTIYLKLKFEADEIYVAPLADEGGDEPVADGFYLIGTFNDWTPSAQYAFVLNPEAAPAVEYKVSVDLQEGDKLKGLAVIMGQWIYYPEGDDIVVPAEYAGNCTIYFRPEYNPDWAAFGGHIYIVKQSGQGIDEILSEGKAVKVLREGQVLIMKGNRTYTPMGQIVK